MITTNKITTTPNIGCILNAFGTNPIINPIDKINSITQDK